VKALAQHSLIIMSKRKKMMLFGIFGLGWGEMVIVGIGTMALFVVAAVAAVVFVVRSLTTTPAPSPAPPEPIPLATHAPPLPPRS
jgi:hypothetical protein